MAKKKRYVTCVYNFSCPLNYFCIFHMLSRKLTVQIKKLNKNKIKCKLSNFFMISEIIIIVILY